MSKSLGNGVDPLKVIDDYGTDPFRYYMAKNMTKTDSLMGYELIDGCYHGDLVNNISNVTYRVLKMVKGCFPEALAIPETLADDDERFLDRVFRMAADAAGLEPELENIRIRTCRIQEIASCVNALISERKPWQLTAEEDAPCRDSLLAALLESIRLMHIVAWPVMPENAGRTLHLLGFTETQPVSRRFFRDGQRIGEPYIAFMRKVKAADRGKKSPGK